VAARVPESVKDGGGVPVLMAFLLSKRSAPRYDEARGRMVRNRVKFFRVYVPYTRKSYASVDSSPMKRASPAAFRAVIS